MEAKKFLKVIGKQVDKDGTVVAEATAVVPYEKCSDASLPDVPPFNTNVWLDGDTGYNMTSIRYTLNGLEYFYHHHYDFEDEKHWLPGEGDIQWDTLYKTLQEVGYDGVWMYELGFKSDFRSRELTPEDFVRNAKEIFAGKPLTVIPKK